MKKYRTCDTHQNDSSMSNDIISFDSYKKCYQEFNYQLTVISRIPGSNLLHGLLRTFSANNMQLQYKLPSKDKEGYDNGTLDTYFFVVKGMKVYVDDQEIISTYDSSGYST